MVPLTPGPAGVGFPHPPHEVSGLKIEWAVVLLPRMVTVGKCLLEDGAKRCRAMRLIAAAAL
jgi:hypothetical protein